MLPDAIRESNREITERTNTGPNERRLFLHSDLAFAYHGRILTILQLFPICCWERSSLGDADGQLHAPKFNLIAYRLSGGRTSTCRSFIATTDEIIASRARYEQGLSDWRRINHHRCSIPKPIESVYQRPPRGPRDTISISTGNGIIHDVSAHAFPRVAQFIANRNARKRIGFVSSANFHDGHPVQKLFSGWMALLDKNRIRNLYVHVGRDGRITFVRLQRWRTYSSRLDEHRRSHNQSMRWTWTL